MVGLFDKKSRRASIYLCISRGSPHCCQSAFWRERVVAQAGEQRPPMVSRNPDLIDRVRVSLSPTILAGPRITALVRERVVQGLENRDTTGPGSFDDWL